MCIAIVKPRGIKLPGKNTLHTCWTNNPDGAGFCYNNGQNVVIHKGYMDFKSFYKALQRCNKLNNLNNKDVAIHFRISTSGGVKPENTHPFCVSTRLKDLTRPYFKCKDAFIHNGIISGYGNKEYSDTMEYVTKVIANIKNLDGSRELIDNLATEKRSRFAVVTRNGFLLGGDWTKDDGIYYSNTSYKPYVPKYTATKVYNNNVVKDSYTNCNLFNTECACDWCENPYHYKDLHSVFDSTRNCFDYVCPDCYAIYKELLGDYNKGQTTDIYNK